VIGPIFFLMSTAPVDALFFDIGRGFSVAVSCSPLNCPATPTPSSKDIGFPSRDRPTSWIRVSHIFFELLGFFSTQVIFEFPHHLRLVISPFLESLLHGDPLTSTSLRVFLYCPISIFLFCVETIRFSGRSSPARGRGR